MGGGKIHRSAYVECDGASCHEFVEGDSFIEMWNDAKTDGWTSQTVDGAWTNYCPECSSPFGNVKLTRSRPARSNE